MAPLACHREALTLLGGNLEGVVRDGAAGQIDDEADTDVGGMAARSAPYRSDPAAALESELHRVAEALAHEGQRVDEVALAGAVGADEDRQWLEVDGRLTDALVVANMDAAQPRDTVR